MIKGGDLYRLVTDQLGSVRLVVRVSDGAIAQKWDYDAWGVATFDASAVTVAWADEYFQPFGFAGGLYDPDTGLVRFGARDYDPEVGRWTTKDPIGFGGGQANLYAYSYSDPVNWIDPDGELAWFVAPIIGAAIGGGIDLGVQFLMSGGDLACADINWKSVAISAAIGPRSS